MTDLKRRGRPAGSMTAVWRDQQPLGRHHFAFLRAWLQGLDLKTAWMRYLSFAERSDDLRHVERRRQELMARVLADGGSAARAEAFGASHILSGVAAPARARALPSLDEFVEQQGFDPDQFSQAELVEEYLAHFGLNQLPDEGPGSLPAEAPSLRQAQLRALQELETGLARRPQPEDALARWFSPVTLPLLLQTGAANLGELRQRIGATGGPWFAPIRGLGARRARAIETGLANLASQWEQAATAGVGSGVEATASAATASPFLRRAMDDPTVVGNPAALQGWLKQHESSPATHRAYAKEVERLCLWCLHVLHKPLLAVDAVDCAAYRRFLAQVPADWIEPTALPRQHPAWRPFRGQLKAASQRHALVVVQALFKHLQGAGESTNQPVSRGTVAAIGATDLTPVRRVLSDGDRALLLAHIDRAERSALGRQQTTTALPAGAAQRRLRLVLSLLCGTGLRLSELVNASTSDIAHTTPPKSGRVALLTVVGPGQRVRQVPLTPALLELMAAHHADAASVGALPCPAPIVCTLRATSGSEPSQRRLGANGLYRLLKRFFLQVSAPAQAAAAPMQERTVDANVDRHAAHLGAASTSWLRHTFGQLVLAAGQSLPVLQQALGHSSLATTRRFARAAAAAAEPSRA